MTNDTPNLDDLDFNDDEEDDGDQVRARHIRKIGFQDQNVHEQNKTNIVTNKDEFENADHNIKLTPWGKTTEWYFVD